MTSLLTTSPRRSRQGFTLLELLVVIALITLLTGILVVSIGRFTVIAKERATQALIAKLHAQVQQRVEELARKRTTPQFIETAKNVSFGAPVADPAARQVLHLKSEQRRYFPQSFADVNAADFAKDFSSSHATTPFDQTKHRAETESSEMLYYFLTRGRALGAETMDADAFGKSEVADTDGDGLPEFIDAWGKPLRFYRWPTRLLRPTGNGGAIDRTQGALLLYGSALPKEATPDPLASDPEDPNRILSSQSNVSALFPESSFHTLDTFHQFLIISSGPDAAQQPDADKAFGLYAPTDTTNFGHLARPLTGGVDAMTDNITNRNRQ